MKSIKSGITLVEVVLAVLILGIAATSLLGLQGVLLRGVFSAHSLLERLGFIRSYIVTASKDRLYEQQGPQEKVIELPALTMSYQQTKPTSQKLADQPHLVVDQVDAEWQTPSGTRKATFAQLAFRPQKKKTKDST